LQPSSALAWKHDASRLRPRGSLPEDRLVLNGYVLARVRGGLDVFVTSCGAEALRVSADQLEQVGLRLRGRRRTESALYGSGFGGIEFLFERLCRTPDAPTRRG
jgi:hypothetical protein